MAGVQNKFRYNHSDMGDLEKQLVAANELQHSRAKVSPLGSAQGRLLRLPRARLAALAGSALPGETSPLGTHSAARASRLQSRRFLTHRLWPFRRDETHWVDVAKYVGSTTGTTRTNEVCSMYAPITWQVDRTCHKVSAWSFDQMCKMMLDNPDDMSSDVHPHGARELILPEWAVDTVYRQ